MSKPVEYHLGRFPPRNIDWESLVPVISKANQALGKYSGLLSAIPNPHILLSPLIVREAVLSSKIEGTNVSITDVLEFEAGLMPEDDVSKQIDAQEVINYRESLIYASKQIMKRSFDLDLLLETHKLLLKGVRGQNKNPGAFRTRQNWLGTPGSTIEQAKFIPIRMEHLKQGIDSWLEYYHDRSIADPLVQLAMVHLEFEAIHPFLDGNGRMGRILIPLFLFERKILSTPNFYMSGYLEANRSKYIRRMRDVSFNDTWTEWCEFFLNGVTEQAADNRMKVESILKLQQDMQEKIANTTHSQFSAKVADLLISFPFFDRNRFCKFTGMSKSNAIKILNKLCDENIVENLNNAGGRRSNVYVFHPLLKIIE